MVDLDKLQEDINDLKRSLRLLERDLFNMSLKTNQLLSKVMRLKFKEGF